MKRTWWKSLISMVLCTVMVLQMVPMNVLAEEFELPKAPLSRPDAVEEMNTVTYSKGETLRNPVRYYPMETPKGVLVDADENSVTYQISEDTFVTQIGGERNVYLDERGNICVADNDLVQKNRWFSKPYFTNEAGQYSVNLPLEITKDNGVKLVKLGHEVEMIPVGGDFSQIVVAENAARYNNVYDGVDIQYTVLSSGLKEDIILNKAGTMTEFTFELRPGKLEVQEKDGVITLHDKQGNEVFVISAPEMVDASGVVSMNLKLKLDREDSRYLVTVIADRAWLDSADRAYPVRVDPTVTVSGGSIGLYGVEQTHGEMVIGDNGYPYAGYDDGITSKNLQLYGTYHGITRTYAWIDYDFRQIPTEAKINKATFSMYHYTAWSRNRTVFGLYTVDTPWKPYNLNWNSQTGFGHTYVDHQNSNERAGWVEWTVTDVVNSWVQFPDTQNGFVVKALEENTMQCEVFHNKVHTNCPKLEIVWSIPDPVDPNYPLDQINIALRPMTEKNVGGKLIFDAVFADGLATPGSWVAYRMEPDGVGGTAYASASFKYPDSSAFESAFPNATKYKDKLGNWQTQLFGGLTFDKLYHVAATASKDGQTSPEAASDTFLIYKIKQMDTFPYIANYYGVPLNTIMRDNRVQDTLVVENNTIFIRNPKTNVPYSPAELDDDAKKAIDSALMGRGLHCEYGFEPVNFNTGNFYFNATDVSIPELNGDFVIERTYNSKAGGSNSRFGRNWSFGYDESLSMCEDGTILYSVGDGKYLYFVPDGNGGYISPAGYYYDLKQIPYTQGEDTLYRYELHMTDGSRKEFNAWGLMTAVVDRNGFVTAIGYDENYQPNSLTSPTGKVYGIVCDEMGRISKVTLPNGAELRYIYDEHGDLVEHVDANGNSIRYVYDDQHRMVQWYDQEGNCIVSNVYDDQGRVTSQTDANGHNVKLEYSEGQTVTTDANGNQTVYSFDELLRTTKINHPNGKVEEMSYDENNNLVRDDDYTYTYDENGNKLTETRRDGAVRSYAYNDDNQVTQITGFDGTVTRMDYSDAGDLVRMTYADGTTEEYAYDDLHRVTSYKNANGDTEYFEYEGAVATKIKDFNGNEYRYGYNAMNQKISTTASDGSVSRIMYNAAGVMTGEQAADGGYTEYTLNKIGNVVRVTDPMGYASDFAYDGMYNILVGTDPLGGTVTYTYDGNGNKLTETDAEGYVTAYAYDSMNQLVNVTDPNGGITTYTYDLEGNLIETVDANGGVQKTTYDEVLQLPLTSEDALGNQTVYTYDINGKPLTITYPDGTGLEYVYDTMGRMVRFTDETGLTSEFVYDGNGNILKMTENGERVYSYEYDANGNLLRAVDPMGGVVTNRYDAMGRKISITNPLGAVTKYGYDAVGRVIRIEDDQGNVVQTEYDLNGHATKQIAANSAERIYNYDAVGNLISEKDAYGSITNYAYDKLQRLTSVTDALNGVVCYDHDGNGNLTKVTDALGYASNMTYDALGNTLTVKLENGDTTTFTYDKLNRVIESTDAAGLTKSYCYDVMGRVLETTDNTGSVLTYVYDEYGRLKSQTDVIGRSEVYSYDAFSQVISVVGTDLNETTYTYDALGRLTSVTDAENKTTSFAYDAVGNLLKQSEADGKVYTYAYDTLNRVTKAVDPIGAETVYGYDVEGNLTSVQDGNGVTVHYAYDKLNRLTSMIDGEGGETKYAFDELSRTISMTDPEGGVTQYRYDANSNLTVSRDANNYETHYAFDSIGNVVSVTSEKGAKIGYTYDKHNNVTSVTDPLGNVTRYSIDLNGLTTEMIQPNGGTYTYTYDAVHRITGITTPNGLTQEYGYDAFGNLAYERDNLDRETAYEYDLMHRLLKVVDPEGNGTSYTYDLSGNVSTILEANGALTSYTYDLMDQVTSQTDPEGKVTQMRYDMVGNVTSVTEAGNRTTQMYYDKNYNLVSVVDPMGFETTQTFDGNNNPLTLTNALGYTVSYEYDPLGQMICTVDAAGEVVKYEYDAHGNIVGITNPLGGKTAYSYDLADRLIRVTDPMERQTIYAYDVMGNLTSQTDADGKVTTYTYDLEGNMTSITDPDGRREQMTYDIAGNLKSIVHPDSTTVVYDYDKLNALVSKTYSQDKSNVLYLYDEMGNRISMTDTTGETTYTYGLMGEVLSVTTGDGKTVRYDYDNCGRLSAITYADDRVVQYGYDLNDRLISVTDGDAVTSYTYDAVGQLIETVRPNGTKTVYAYDVRGNLTELVNSESNGAVISSFVYTYDARGYITKEIAADAERTVERRYFYNDSGELTKFTEREGMKVAEYIYTYDNSGNRIRLEKNGIEQPETITYVYNEANRLISQTSTIDGTTTFVYNENGSLISESTEGDEEITYEYTVEQRLSAVREGGALLMAASYDGDGNRVFQISRRETEHYVQMGDTAVSVDTPVSPETGHKGTVGSIPSTDSGTGIQLDITDLNPIPETNGDVQQNVHTYYERVYVDPADSIFWYGFGQGFLQFFANLNSALASYLSDWFCHLWDFVTAQYELVLHSEVIDTPYAGSDVDALRMAGLGEQEIADITGGKLDDHGMVAVGVVSSNAAGDKSPDGTQTESLGTDAEGETIVIPENPEATERVDYELTYYVNNVNTENTQVLMEYGKRDELKNVYTYGMERISVDTITDVVNTTADEIETDFYLYDGRGSVANVVSAEAQVLNSYSYDPFGNVTMGQPEFDSFYGYNAEDTNPVTGLQYLRARYYDTENGRFNVADTYLGDVSEPLTLNRYTYTVNNPVMHIDPSGNFFLTALAIGAAIGAVAGAVSVGYGSYIEQKAGGGKVNGWEVAKDALWGGVKGAALGAIGGAAVAGAAVIGTTAAIVTGVGVVTAGVGMVGSSVTNAQGRANQKDYDALVAQEEALLNGASAKVYSQQYIAQRIAEIEKRKLELCAKAEKLQKQADIFGGVTSIGLGIAAIGASAAAGPQLVTLITGNTFQAGMYVAGTMTVGNIASIGLGTVGGLGIAYGSAEVGEGTTGDNWIKDAYGTVYDYQHKDDVNKADYEANKEAAIDSVFAEHQGAIDSVNTITTALAASSGAENWALSRESQNKTKVTADDIQFSDKFSKSDYVDQVAKRGWTKESIADAINNPVKTQTGYINKYTGNPVTDYFVDDVHYVTVDNITGKVIKVSNLNISDWR